MTNILIIEDDEHIRMALEDDLRLEGFLVESAADGEKGLIEAKKNCYDLIILDLMLPQLNGMEVCRQLRQAKIATPIIMLTAKSQELDKILGLELGADDYVTKPFSPRELLARIKAILRRSRPADAEVHVYRFDEFEIDFKKYSATQNGKPIALTALEFGLLRLFMNHPNEVLSRDFILNELWGEDVLVTNRTVDTHVANLRKKIEADPGNPKYIIGIRGVGYRWEFKL